MINQNIACAREMIGFYLNQRREARLCLDIENEIKRMLQEEEQNDISQSGKKIFPNVISLIIFKVSVTVNVIYFYYYFYISCWFHAAG